jgi:hypothetical protein
MTQVSSINFIVDDDLDYGIDHLEQAIIYDDNIQLTDSKIINPFFVGIAGGNLAKQDKSKIYQNYKSVVILCMSNNSSDNITLEKFYEYSIKKSDLSEISGINYFKTSINILKNSDHYFKATIVNKEYLQQLFPIGDFQETEIVLSILELDETNAKLYCDSYNTKLNLSDIELQLTLTNHFINNEYTQQSIQTSIINTFNKLVGVNYWSNSQNCDINLTTTFIDREFNNRHKTGIQLLSPCKAKQETIDKDKTKQIKKNVNTNYVPEQEELNATKTEFVDPSIVIRQPRNGKKRTFFVNSINSTSYSNKQVEDIYSLLKTEKERYYFLNNLLVSKDLCHLFVNNKNLLEQAKPIIDKYLHVFKYTWGYSWIPLYLEESLKRTNAAKTDRFVFDINTANKLPSFPYNLRDLKQNPYLTLLIDDAEINSKDNCLGFEYQENYDGYGVTDFQTFQKRFNIFTTGNKDIGIFDGIVWDKFAISGSIIPACLQKRSPLLDYFVKEAGGDENIGFNNFVNKYYGSSDIDLMCNDSSTIEFIKNIQGVYDIFKTNTKSTDEQIKIETFKNVAVMITKYFFEDCLDDFNKKFNLTVTEADFEKYVDDFRFKFYIYTKYIEQKEKQSFKLLSEKQVDPNNKFCKEYLMPFPYDSINIFKTDDKFYGEEYKKSDVDILLYRNDFTQNKFEQKDNHCVIKIAETVRFKITSTNINKTFEIFKIRDKDFFNSVANFHFPCVRAYYQGTNVYMLPSCITAMQTGLNIEYKYFAGIRNPVEIINKYAQRGFGVILNKYETKLWVDSFGVSENTEGELNMVGVKTLKNHIFKLDQTKIVDKKTIKTNDEINKFYKKYSKDSCIDFTKMTSINKAGHINKFNPGFIQLCYDEMN